MKSIWVKSMCKKSFYGEKSEKYVGENLWVKICEESLGEKYMGEMYVQEEFLGEESLGEFLGESIWVKNMCKKSF